MTWPNTVRKEDLRIDWFSGTGPGGQHKNKHQNCCRITHIHTGITAQAQEERSRKANLSRAFKRLAALLEPIMVRSVQRERYSAGHERVRTYHEPQDRVTDHRINRQWSYQDIVNGSRLKEIIQELQKVMPG